MRYNFTIGIPPNQGVRMYNRDRGQQFVKSLSNYARKLYKRSKSKTQRVNDKREIRNG